MSLLPFHRLLIATAIAFCLGFALWLLTRADPSVGEVALAIAFFLAGGALVYYLLRLRHFLGLEEKDR